MFTRRHEQELAEIKELSQALERRLREALEQSRRIREGYVFEDAHTGLGDGAAAGSPESERDGLGEAIDALAARHELGDEVAKRLEDLVWLVDWGRANFVPVPASRTSAPDPRGVRTASRRVVMDTLSEALAGLEIEVVRSARRIGDIGSGAGFPGLVLAVALPKVCMTLIEKVPERCTHLRHTIEELGLDDAEVFEGNVLEWSEGIGACDVVTSRKVGRIETVLNLAAPLLAPGGSVVLFPGATDFAEDGPEAAVEAADALGLALAQSLPVHAENRKGRPIVKHLYVYRKATAPGDPSPATAPQISRAAADSGLSSGATLKETRG